MKIRIQILGDHYEVLREAALDVPKEGTREALVPLDYPSKDCDALTAAVLCTPRNQRVETEELRRQLASTLTAEFIAFFASNDTEMGYPGAKP